jgi:hypothetical protein
MKKLLVIDAQGGGIGKQIISELVKRNINVNIVAVGTNATATSQMIKAGAAHGATGENPVVVGCRDADYIIGPIGIVIADSMYGEITPKMAVSVGQSRAKKILIPIVNCGNYVVGISEHSMKGYIDEAVAFIQNQCGET